MENIAKGIWKIGYGEPEEFTPEHFRIFKPKISQIEQVPVSRKPEFPQSDIEFTVTARGVTLKLPMETDEDIYGFGLQLHRVNQAGRRRYVKVNSDPPADTGESHAPVPFYVSTAGYGIYVDTYRYATFELGTNTERGTSAYKKEENLEQKEFSESALYALKRSAEKRSILIDIPAARGVEIYVFEGDVAEVVRRYNLFSGGGCVPPMWGLGVWYRGYGGSNQEQILALARQFREEHIPTDVLGLEPGWHSHSYSCSYKWSDLFPDPKGMTDVLADDGYKLNLWEHLYVYPTAPFYSELMPYSGDYEVWNGLVPDFATGEARTIFEDYHYNEFVEKGILGFKLDECDNSDYNASNWAFPDCASFPSGLDGEQMHMAIGTLYQQSVYGIFKRANRRTYSQVRASGALSAPLPFVLYSDLYDHRQFIKGMVGAGFSGLLWCPEVRSCKNGTDLLRRIETTVFSVHALINSWRIPNPPWKQVDIDKNLGGELMEDAAYYTDAVRKLFDLRMSLLPYLYSAFVRYHNTGVPPVRSLVFDDPEDIEARNIEDQYMFGDDLLICPLVAEDGTSREVYLPDGNWYNFFTKEKVAGGRRFTVHADDTEIPVYVREGAIVPLAKPVEYVGTDTVFEITVLAFGTPERDFVLYEDDFVSFDYEKEQSGIVLDCADIEKKLLPEDTVKYRFDSVVRVL